MLKRLSCALIVLLAASAASAADFSSPEGARKEIVAATEKSDAAAFSACWASDSQLAKDFVGGYSELLMSSNRLQLAVSKKWTEASAMQGSAVLADVISKGTLKVDGDKAVITPAEKSPGSPYHLKKVGSEWKFDPVATFKLDNQDGEKMAKSAIDVMPKSKKVIEQLREEVESGKLADYKAFDARAKELMSQVVKDQK